MASKRISFGFKRRACFKAALSGLKQILEIANPLKMMKNAFYFALLKDLLALEKLLF